MELCFVKEYCSLACDEPVRVTLTGNLWQWRRKGSRRSIRAASGGVSLMYQYSHCLALSLAAAAAVVVMTRELWRRGENIAAAAVADEKGVDEEENGIQSR